MGILSCMALGQISYICLFFRFVQIKNDIFFHFCLSLFLFLTHAPSSSEFSSVQLSKYNHKSSGFVFPAGYVWGGNNFLFWTIKEFSPCFSIHFEKTLKYIQGHLLCEVHVSLESATSPCVLLCLIWTKQFNSFKQYVPHTVQNYIQKYVCFGIYLEFL